MTVGSPALANRSRMAFLCYHSVASPGPPFLSISAETFEGHLAVLRQKGWKSGSEETLARLSAGERLRDRTAFLTFDDGYLDNYVTVFPLLQAAGLTAFVFVVPPLLGNKELRWEGVEDSCDQYPDVMRSMTWEMVEEMAAAGNVIGSHTNTHPHLDQIGDEQLRDELVDSRRAIVERLGSCDSLAFPYGSWNARVREAARDAGYRWAFTLPRRGERGADPLAIPRIAVDHRDDARRFGLKLQPLTRRAILSPWRGPVEDVARGVVQKVRQRRT